MIKSWFTGSRSHKIREIEDTLPIQRHDSKDVAERPRAFPMPATRFQSAAKLAASKSSNRMSIERYLNAPLEEEPASMRAINAALSRQTTPNMESLEPEPEFEDKSRDSYSLDNNSDGQRTFYTSGSSSISTGTSYSVVSRNSTSQSLRRSRSQRSQKSEKQPAMPEIPKSYTDSLYEKIPEVPKSYTDSLYEKMPERPKSSGTTLSKRYEMAFERPRTSGGPHERPQVKIPERPKSSGTSILRSPDKTTEKTLEKTAEKPSEKKPAVQVTFYCTFCERSFRNRQDWVRHEQRVHMPEELWVCCPRTEAPLPRCPFCPKVQPKMSHLATHNYVSCQAKPISERTFSRKDHFLQHIAQVHELTLWQKPFRLTELLEQWRHPMPLKEGHPALHCGFCGRTFKSYEERTEHVAAHFLDGLDMMSWWSARVNHIICQPNISKDDTGNPDLPYRCCYCQRQYANRVVAQKEHPFCTMWSCSFLAGLQYTIYPSGQPPKLDALCCFCNDPLESDDQGKVKGNLLRKHMHQHNFRNCSQRLYFSAQRYRQHLQDSHKINHDGTLFAGWTLLLRSCRQQKPSVFEPVDTSLVIRRVYTDPGSTPQEILEKMPEKPRPKTADKLDRKPSQKLERKPSKKLQRKASSSTLPENPVRPLREVKSSEHFFQRSRTVDDLGYSPTSEDIRCTEQFFEAFAAGKHQHRPGFPVNSLPLTQEAGNTCPTFYRRRLDASTRNRIYVREQSEPPLSKNSQRLFRKVPGSAFGTLILHSTLVGATAAQMTPSLDIYPLH